MQLNTNNIPVQPVVSLKYFKKEKSNLPSGISSAFYLSWEDVLWDIIISFQIKKDTIVLVPSFFCVDVMNNIKDHGLTPIYYEVDKNLQPIQQDIEFKIKRHNVTFLVLFHAVGITNKLITKKFIQGLSKDIFIIEDCVHRITNPKEVIIYSDKHVVINSLRKVIPLQGSCIFAMKHVIDQLKGPQKTVNYSWSVIILWIAMQIALLIQQLFIKNMGLCAEWFMLKGYDIIGDNKKTGYCPQIFNYLYFRLNFDHIKNIKREQSQLYSSLIVKNSNCYTPRFTKLDDGELRGYPLILKKTIAKKIILSFRIQNIYIRPELNDSKWTQDRTIIYLPMGLHIQTRHIRYITTLLNSSVARYSKSS